MSVSPTIPTPQAASITRYDNIGSTAPIENYYANKDAPQQSHKTPGYALGDTIEIMEIETIQPTTADGNAPIAEFPS